LLPKVISLTSNAPLRAAELALEQESLQRREAESILRHTQKMDAIGQLTGGVAHDFNNLLTIISGNLEIADRSTKEWGENTKERLTRAIARASSGAQRAAMLTQRLLAFARRQPLDPHVINVNQLIGGMADFFQRTLGETIDLEIIGGAALWGGGGGPGQMGGGVL